MATERTELKDWQERIKNGQRFQLKVARSQEWDRFKNYYRHEFTKGSMPVNLVYSLLRSITPQIYLRNPKITITPRKPGLESEMHARIVQKLDNWLLQELFFKREAKKLIADNFFCGIGAGFIGYDSAFGFSPKFLDPTGQYTMTQFNSQGNRIETDAKAQIGMPWFLRARPEDIVFPYGCVDQESAEWVATRIFRKVRDMKADKKYSNTSDLSGTHVPIRTQPEGGIVQEIEAYAATLKDEEWVELWQVHDARTGQVLALTMEHDKLLRKDTDELQIEGLPIETLTFNPDPDHIYGIPDVRVIEPQLLELIEIRTQAMKHRRVDIIKGLVKEDALTDEEIEKLTNQEVMAIIRVKTDSSIRDAFTPVSPGSGAILQDMALAGNVIRDDLQELIGFSRPAMGQYQGKTHISAAETNKVSQSLNLRMDERRDAMADLLSKVVRRWNQLIFTYWSQERVTDVIGPDGGRWWLKFSGQQIKGEYDMKVTPEEGPDIDSEAKKMLGLQAADVWAKLNAGAIAQGMPVPPEIQRLIFAQFEDTGLDIDRLLAQTQAVGQGMQQLAASGAGQAPGQAISPAEMARMSQGGQ